MLKATRVTLSWQRLIGVASGTFRAALTIATGAQLSEAGSIRGQTLQEITLICGCVFLFLAFPLFAGREWARRALLFTTYCILAALAIFLSFTVFQQLRSPAAVYPALRLIIGYAHLSPFSHHWLSFWLCFITLTSGAHS